MFEISNVKLKKTGNDTSKVVAAGSVTICEAFVVKDIKVVDGPKGLFVAMPSKKVDDKYSDIAHPITADARDMINNAVLEAYKALT